MYPKEDAKEHSEDSVPESIIVGVQVTVDFDVGTYDLHK